MSEYTSSKIQPTCPEAGLPSELLSVLGKSLVSISNTGTLGAAPCPVPWERSHDPGSFMLSSEAQAMPEKEGELTGAEEPAEFTQEDFLGEAVL